jgi:hypothetical protein
MSHGGGCSFPILSGENLYSPVKTYLGLNPESPAGVAGAFAMGLKRDPNFRFLISHNLSHDPIGK